MQTAFFVVILALILCRAKSDENCTKLRDNFADNVSVFTYCAIYHSRPITLCENCIQPYIDVVESYQNLSQPGDLGQPCSKELVHLDRLEIIETFYLNVKTLWNNAKCSECFRVKNGHQTPIKTNKTITFEKFYDKYTKCIENPNITNKTLCPNCMGVYLDLNKFYAKINHVYENHGICMDVVDLMNSTWIFWSTNCCKYREQSETIFIASAIGVLVLTILFYFVVLWRGSKKNPTILQQTRFAESLNNLSS